MHARKQYLAEVRKEYQCPDGPESTPDHQQHALIPHLKQTDLRRPRAGAVGDLEEGAIADRVDDREQARDLVLGEEFDLLVLGFGFGWRIRLQELNRFLNIGVLGNYSFVKAGFAVFYPNHRAAFAFPASSFRHAYVGSAKDRDPVEVLTDDCQ